VMIAAAGFASTGRVSGRTWARLSHSQHQWRPCSWPGRSGPAAAVAGTRCSAGRDVSDRTSTGVARGGPRARPRDRHESLCVRTLPTDRPR
jgi:hypothetical protein